MLGSVIGELTATAAGADGTGFGGAVGGAAEGVLDAGRGRTYTDPLHFYRVLNSAARGGLTGFVGGEVNQIVGALIDQNNQDCKCKT